ncbi:MAG: hypothetical protein ACRDJ9_16175 [Dehalococcoidia bacterium]
MAAAVALTMVTGAGSAFAGEKSDQAESKDKGEKGEKGNACPPPSKGHGRTPPPGCGKDGEDGKKDTCSDGKDNDKDGKTDGDDPECQDKDDKVEDGSDRNGGEEICDNGKDDDGDGKIDDEDPDCPPVVVDDFPECSDGIDNDGDEVADDEDPSCHTDGNAENPDSYDPTHDDEFDCSRIGHESVNYGPLTGPLHSQLLHQFPDPIAGTGDFVLCGVAFLTGGSL